MVIGKRASAAKSRKFLRWILPILLVLYVGQIVLFESLLVSGQPVYSNTIVITTFDTDGVGHDRVVARLEKDGVVYVSVNHWPRGWFLRLDANPAIRVTYQGTTTDYTAATLRGAEYEEVAAYFPLPLSYRFMSGFPPRYIVRLDPN